MVLIERIEALRNILEPDSVRSSIAAVEFQDTDCGSDAVIFHSQTHLISVGLGSDPQVAWTGLRSQAVLQRIFIAWRSAGAQGTAMHPTAPFSAHRR